MGNQWISGQAWRDAHKEPKTVGETLGTKGRNPIELRGIKRIRGNQGNINNKGKGAEKIVRKKLRTKLQKEN